MRVPWRRGGVSERSGAVRFVPDSMVGLTPGERALLRSARERRGYSIEELAGAMDVRPGYLTAVERGELHRELSLPHVRSIVARYAMFVGLDPDAFVARFDGPEDPAATREPSLVRAAVGAGSRRARGRIVTGAVTIAALSLGFYGAMQFGVLRGAADDQGIPSSTTETTQALTSTPTTVSDAVSALLGSVSSTATTVSVDSSAGSTEAEWSTTTTSGPPEAASQDAAMGAAGTAGQSGADGSDDSFLVRLRPTAEVWMEVTYEVGGAVLFSGTRAMDEVFELRSDGPLRVMVGRPEAIKISLDRRRVATPASFEWRVSHQGVVGLSE